MTLGQTSRGKFVHQKVSKIRWRPSKTQSGRISGSQFVTGTWDDQVNTVSLWSWLSSDDDPSFDQNEGDKGSEPDLLATYNHSYGDVNELQFLNYDVVACASSDGGVVLLQLARDGVAHYKDTKGWNLNEVCHWKKVHGTSSYKSSCNSVSCAGELVVSAGEDGKLALLNPKHSKQPIRSYSKADSCSLTGVKFVKNDEVAAINMRGQIKIWDLRSSSEEPSKTCILSSEQIGLTCIARHPVQSHVLCTGCADGVLAFWDLRKESHPVTLLNAHPQPVSEIHFHDQQPDHVFSCSQTGDVLHWNGMALARSSAASFINFANQGSTPSMPQPPSGCVWLNSDVVKHRVETQAIMSSQSLPINSIDILGSSLLVGGDNEAIYLVEKVIP